MNTVRCWIGTLLAIGSFFSLLGVPAGLAHSSPIQDPHLAVSPNSGLSDRQAVEVAGSGLSIQPADEVALSLYECPGRQFTDSCFLLTLGFGIDSNGSFKVSVRARSLVQGVDGSVVDCRSPSRPCRIVLRESSRTLATAILRLDPMAEPLPQPRVRVDPHTHLVEDEVVSVVGSHFPALSRVDVLQCASFRYIRLPCVPLTIDGLFVDSSGLVELELSLSETFVWAASSVRCPLTVCSLVMGGEGRWTAVPLHFESVPANPPSHAPILPVPAVTSPAFAG